MFKETFTSEAFTSQELKAMLEEAKAREEREAILAQHPNKIYESGGRWYTKLPGVDGRKKTVCRKTRDGIEEAVISYYKDIHKSMTIREAFDRSQKRKKEEGSIGEATVVRNEVDFRRFYQVWENRDVQTITEEDLAEHIRMQKIERKLSLKGYANLKAVTRIIWKQATRDKMTTLDVEKVLDSFDWGKNAFIYEDDKGEEEKKDFFEDEEVKRIVLHIKREGLTPKRLAILLLFATGLRCGELAALKWTDWDEEGHTLTVKATETLHKYVKNSPKTQAGKRRVIVPSAAAWIFEELRRQTVENGDGFIFYEVDHRKPKRGAHRIRAEYIRKELYSICDALGIQKRGLHSIRKTYSSILLDEAISDKFIIETMGHTDISTTNGSYARPRRTAEQRLQVIDSVQEFGILQEARNA